MGPLKRCAGSWSGQESIGMKVTNSSENSHSQGPVLAVYKALTDKYKHSIVNLTASLVWTIKNIQRAGWMLNRRMKSLALANLQSRRAYRCFCSPERLDNVRREAQRYQEQGSYDRKCYHLNVDESRRRAKDNEPHVVRLLVWCLLGHVN